MTLYITKEGWIKHRYLNPSSWLQLTGEEIKISDMSTEHLKNSIAMLERSGHDYSDSLILENMNTELKGRAS